MLKLITVDDVRAIIQERGLNRFLKEVIEALQEDYSHWNDFEKIPRQAMHRGHGVMELMPICGNDLFAFKYVNGHPRNPKDHKQTVVAVGMLADVKTGYPILVSEMTILTAIRTAALSALAAKYLARKNASCLAIIGTGAQSELQVLAHCVEFGIKRVRYFDKDSNAMDKFSNHLSHYDLILEPASSPEAVIKEADIVITATASREQAFVLQDAWISPGMHINALGGDCPGKTELDPAILKRSKVAVEYLEQTQIEGEIQQVDPSLVHAELWELVNNKKPGRESDQEITVFDSVGFALQDYSILKYVYKIAEALNIGEEVALIPELDHPKDLFSLIV